MSNNNQNLNDIEPTLITLKEVVRRTTRSRSSIWRDIHSGRFPIPIKIGARVAFKSSEISEWIESRPRVQLNPSHKGVK